MYSCRAPSGTQVDSLGDLIPFAFAAAYLFFKFAGRRRGTQAKARPASPAARTRSVSGPTPFEQLLARLEAGINEAGAPPRPAAPSPEVAAAGRRESAMFADNRAARAASEARSVQATAFRSLERPGASEGGGLEQPSRFDREARGFDHERSDFEHDAHGFGTDNPFSEPAFESAADADRRQTTPGRLSYDPHPPTPAPSPPPAPALRLRSGEALRDAFVLSTILSRRPAPRRRQA